jgi:hypothetical protein
MIDEHGLRDAMAMMLELTKQEKVYSETLGNEVAALRDALQELSGGKFLPILERHRARMRETTAGQILGGSAEYDEIIRQVKAGELF